jgi:uncharacterized membrane protein
MKDLKLCPHTNKLAIDGHALQFTEQPLDYYVQKIRATVSLFYGEYFMDRGMGIPYIAEDVPKHVQRMLIEMAIRTQITGIAGVQQITSFETKLDGKTGQLSIAVAVKIAGSDTVLFEQDVGGFP